MIRVQVRRRGGRLVGFVAEGHAGQAERGRDLVCAAVSALTQVTVLGLAEVVRAQIDVDERDGYLSCWLRSPSDPQTDALLGSLVLGLQHMALDHPRYLRVENA